MQHKLKKFNNFKKHSIFYAMGAVFGLLPSFSAAENIDTVLTQLPIIRAADAAITAAQSNAERLRAGAYEWNVKASAQQRRETATGIQYSEYELGLETTARWPNKVDTDAQLAEWVVQIAHLSRSKALYEARRTLLTDWMEVQREDRIAQILTEQAQLAAQQLETVEKRVKAGEVAPMEAIAAQADHARTQATAVQARARADALVRALHRRYPALAGMPLPVPEPAKESPSPPHAEMIAARVDKHPALALARAQAQHAQLRATRVGQDRMTDPTFGVRATSERDGQEKVVGVYVSIPLGGAGRRADATSAQAESDAAQHQLEQTRKEVEAQLWQATESAVQSHAAWQRLEAVHTLAQRSATLQTRAYSLGESTLNDTLQARRLALESRLAAETARLEAVLAGWVVRGE